MRNEQEFNSLEVHKSQREYLRVEAKQQQELKIPIDSYENLSRFELFKSAVESLKVIV